MNLFFDLGNSRIKWLVQAPGLREYGVSCWEDFGDASQGAQALVKTIEHLQADPQATPVGCLRVYVASVAGRERGQYLDRWLRKHLALEAEYIQVEKSFLGLTVAYEDTTRLGVDRWLAMLAAYQYQQSPCMVVDAGSAITVDYIDENGRHQGGLIAPGLRALSKPMLKGISAVGSVAREFAPCMKDWVPGTDTESCVINGAVAMFAGYIQQSIGYYKQQGLPRTVWLCGGDALLARRGCEKLMDVDRIRVSEHLVLEGLEVWLGSRNAKN